MILNILSIFPLITIILFIIFKSLQFLKKNTRIPIAKLKLWKAKFKVDIIGTFSEKFFNLLNIVNWQASKLILPALNIKIKIKLT